MQLKGFLAGNRIASRTFGQKNNNKVESFLTLFLSTLRWITEKELDFVGEKHENFIAKMRK